MFFFREDAFSLHFYNPGPSKPIKLFRRYQFFASWWQITVFFC
jgi:hypothetical protein